MTVDDLVDELYTAGVHVVVGTPIDVPDPYTPGVYEREVPVTLRAADTDTTELRGHTTLSYAGPTGSLDLMLGGVLLRVLSAKCARLVSHDGETARNMEKLLGRRLFVRLAKHHFDETHRQ